MKITEANFQDAAEGAGARDHRRDRQGDSRRRAGHRARSRARRISTRARSCRRTSRASRPIRRPIFFSKTPAVIVNLDGEPIWSPIKENDLKFAVNTNWDLFQHGPTNTFYLRNNDTLAEGDATSRARGRRPASCPTASRSCRPTTTGRTSRPTCPGKAIAAVGSAEGLRQPAAGRADPADRRAELSSGARAPGSCGSATPRATCSGWARPEPVYYLVAGRWFSAPDFTGPWTFATPTLPADFKKIPLEHERSRVLASVPGTDQAAEAVLLAQIPQTARVNKKETEGARRGVPGRSAVHADREDDRRSAP